LPETSVKFLFTRLSKMPVIIRQRGFRGWVRNMADRKQYMRYAFSVPDIRMVASQFVKDIHEQNEFDDSIQLHPYGHDLSWLNDYRDREPSGSLNVGFIGQIIRKKGVHLLLEAALQLKHLYSDKINFLIYGSLQKDPEYARYLQELAADMENIQFCGTYPHEESAEVFSKFDVLAIPSLWYDFPLIMHEAFAAGKPVIATNLGGMAETVSHEVNGLLFERGNVAELAYHLRHLVDEPRLLQKLRANIPIVNTVKEEVKKLESNYLKLLGFSLVVFHILYNVGVLGLEYSFG